MTTWTIREVADACAMTVGEMSQWVSRGHFVPSAQPKPGLARQFDWRDLACLAVMASLRTHSISLNGIALIVSDLRDDLAKVDHIDEEADLFFFCAEWNGPTPTVGLVRKPELVRVIGHHPASMIIVDVAVVYRKACGRIAGTLPDRGGAA